MSSPTTATVRRGLSLKGILLVFLVVVTLYATAMMVFLALQLGRISADMRRGIDSERFLYEQIVSRMHVLNGAAIGIHQLLSDPGPIDSTTAANMRSDLSEYVASHSFPPLDELPADAREPLMLAQGDANLLESTMLEALALAELGLVDSISRHTREMDSLRVLLDARLTRAQIEAIRDLQARRQVLADSSRQALVALAAWLLVGLVGVPVIWIIARRRIWQPLASLEHGLSTVAQGDLRTEVPVKRLDEVGRLAEHFNSMTGVLRQRAEEQGRFAAAGQLIAGVAHEVNNPLMAIAAMGETRLEDPSLPTDQRAELRHIVRQARRAGRLLSGLLRFVRADSSGLEAADLNAVCREAVELVSHRFGHEDITLDARYTEDLPAARGDPARIEQVMVNLLSNALDALQFVSMPRLVSISSFVHGDHVCVAIEDNGPGIPEDVRKRLFHPFATTKGKKGTGLGLYISRQIVRDLHGDLVFEPADQGARFVLSLPVSSDQPADMTKSPPQAMPRAASLQGLRVLVVDDEVGVRKPLAKYLGRRGARVTEAIDGVDALDKLQHHSVDAIVADLKMPRMNGVELYGFLVKNRPELARRTLLLTGDLAQMEKGPAADIDAERVLLKPVKLSEVEQNLRSLIAPSSGAES